jgi:hypothetical protein
MPAGRLNFVTGAVLHRKPGHHYMGGPLLFDHLGKQTAAVLIRADSRKLWGCGNVKRRS